MIHCLRFILCVLLLTGNVKAQPLEAFSDAFDYRYINQQQLFFPPSGNLSPENAAALSATVLSVYLSATATSYSVLLADSTQAEIPIEKKVLTNYFVSPVSGDTLFQIDLRLYSPERVGSRYCRMLIVRPYDKVVRPCILYTHGNQGNLQSWVTYYFLGVPDMLQRGYAVAFYENWNSLQHIAPINAGDPIYKQWERDNLEDSLVAGSDDKTLQRAHYLLYQYAYAAAAFVNDVAEVYDIDRSKIFTAGHSAGGLASLMLTFAKPGVNFQHPIYEKVGGAAAKAYPGLSMDGMSIRGVFSSGAGLPDGSVEGTYTGEFFDKDDAGKVAFMIHGKNDPAADLSYGPGLWTNFVDTMKLMGPLTLKPLMDANRIRNYTIVNCLGEHGVHMYPFTAQDGGGRFIRLSPLSYQYEALSNVRFERDTVLQQLLKYQQQLELMLRTAASVFAEVVEEKALQVASSVYSWQPDNYSIPMVPDGLSWKYVPASCEVPGAIADYFPTNIASSVVLAMEAVDWKIYPIPAKDILSIKLDEASVSPISINISDASGKQILGAKAEESVISINTGDWLSGMYFISLRDGDGQFLGSRKFLIAR
jgi:pimeloyl-ACP methyl ester carboxylesterase